MASTGCFFHNRRAIRLSSRRANRQSSRSTRFVVITSLFCIVGPPSGDLPLSEDQPRIKPIPYVGISGYPDALLEGIAQYAYEGVKEIGSRIATPETKDGIHTLLNEAWAEFWRNPTGFTAWEEEAVKGL